MKTKRTIEIFRLALEEGKAEQLIHRVVEIYDGHSRKYSHSLKEITFEAAKELNL